MLHFSPMNAFRLSHLHELLTICSQAGGALDYNMSLYFRAHKAIGSKDRAWISDTAYGIIRWQKLIDYLLQDRKVVPTWRQRIQFYVENDLLPFVNENSIPEDVRVSFPLELFERMQKNRQLALALNDRAPTCIRVNSLRISRDELLDRFRQEGYKVAPSTQSPSGIYFLEKINFFGLQYFKDGFFEVQDEASQLAAQLVDAKPGDEIIDFCSGSGGKALAIAEKMGGKGQLYLHDIRKKALIEAKKRLKRAGIQNAQCVHSSEKARLQQFKGRMQWVFVDAPCSGSGTLRRNPDMKWKYSDEMLARLVQSQREIFREALGFLAKNGRLVYATCSILPEENEEQIAYFLRNFAVVSAGKQLKTVPQRNGPDGFFAYVFRNKL